MIWNAPAWMERARRNANRSINLTLYALGAVMQGEIGEVIDALVAHDQATKLAEMEG